MINCGMYRERLEDHALGRPLESRASAHVDSCAYCAGTLNLLRERAAEMDRSLSRLADAEHDTQRLRARISAVIQTAESGALGAWRQRVALAVGGAVVILAAAALQISQPRAQSHLTPALTAAADLSRWRSPTDVLLVSNVAAHDQPSPRRVRGGRHAI